MQRSSKYNPKRGLRDPARTDEVRAILCDLANRVRYGGNPEHKASPGDFGLTPPTAPRRGKSLCDDAGVLRLAVAVKLLRDGLARGLVDRRWDGEGWPQLVWAVDDTGQPFEAQREAEGVYHGYPLPSDDPLREAVLRGWSGT